MRVRAATPLLAALLLAACGGNDDRRPADEAAAPPASAEAPGSSPVRVAPAPSANAPPTGATGAPATPPTSTPAGSAAAPAPPPPEASPEAAVAVVRAYYAAIARRDYETAYHLWGDDGRASRQSFDDFRRGFANTAAVEATTGTPGRIEGAAGSRYVSVPVEVRARTTAGGRQCFRGTYTLRRTVVDGAPAAARRWHLYAADLSAVDAASCAGEPPAVAVPADVADVVRTFGGRLANVSLLAPPDALRRSIRESYAPLVTQPLLDAWLADPTAAPGRTVSSPWPDRIEIRRARRLAADRYAVEGDVAYVTSVEKANGGAVEKKPVVVEVVRTDGGWRIASYRPAS